MCAKKTQVLRTCLMIFSISKITKKILRKIFSNSKAKKSIDLFESSIVKKILHCYAFSKSASIVPNRTHHFSNMKNKNACISMLQAKIFLFLQFLFDKSFFVFLCLLTKKNHLRQF